MHCLKDLFKPFFIFAFIFINVFLPFVGLRAADSHNWSKVASVSNGIQFIDTSTLKYKKGLLFVLAKYSELNPDNQDILNTNIFEMKIDCENRLFKLEGEKWQATKGDKLFTETIMNSCTY